VLKYIGAWKKKKKKKGHPLKIPRYLSSSSSSFSLFPPLFSSYSNWAVIAI
jgi:hypothetical protein